MTHRVAFISHDAGRTGAPIVLGHLAGWLAASGQVRVSMVLPSHGPMTPIFAAAGPVTHLDRCPPLLARWLGRVGRVVRSRAVYDRVFVDWSDARKLLAEANLVYLNSVASASLLRRLGRPSVPVVLHVHELAGAYRRYTTAEDRAFLAEVTTEYIAASEPVAEYLVQTEGVQAEQVTVIPECVALPGGPDPTARAAVRAELGLSADAFLVVGCGVAQPRKGTDLFADVAAAVGPAVGGLPTAFAWVGRWESRAYRRELAPRAGAVRFVGERVDPSRYFRAADLFLLTSREDPFPLAALEAAAAGLPVLCFAGTGGIPPVFGAVADVVVPAFDATAMATRAVGLLADTEERRRVGDRLAALVQKEYVVSACGPQVSGVIERALARRGTRSAVPTLPAHGGGAV